jgi:hypothetical protein
MANPPGRPLTGGMEPQQDFALRTVQEKQAAQQQQPAQESELSGSEADANSRT